jgi:hypothetical protein
MKVYSQARTEKTDRDLTKPQKEIFIGVKRMDMENTSTTCTISIFAYFDKKSKIELYSR